MKTVAGAATLVALVALSPVLVAQSGNDLFQKALSKERVDGQLAEAIALYERVVKDFAADRALAAKALVQMGRCYERLGKPDAKRAYERVVQEFADQKASVVEARARLAEIDRANTVHAPSTRRVWAGSDVDLGGAPSPDGRYVTFTDWETGDVAMRDLTTGAKRRLTKNALLMQAPGYAERSAPSPDGRRVAYIWIDHKTGYELRSVGVDGTAPRVIYANSSLAFLTFAWMPDGQRIVLASKGLDGSNQIGIVSVAERAIRPLRSFDWRSPGRLSVSPDGRFIAYDFPPREDSPNRDVFVVASDGSSGAAAIEHPANDLFPLWTPDGAHIMFASDRNGTPALWDVPVSNGKPSGAARVIQSIGRVLPLGFARNGSLYYGLQTSSVDVYTATLDPESGKVLGQPRQVAARVIGSNQRPDWSPDGRWLAYSSDRVPGRGLGSRIVSILSTDTKVERELSPALSYFQAPRWSPDGRTLLVNGDSTTGRHGLFTIDATTGALSTIGTFASAFGHTWARDGGSVFFTGKDDERRGILVKNLHTGDVRELYRPPRDRAVGDAAVSPDGRWLAFREGNDPTMLRVIPSTGGDAREVVRIPLPEIIRGAGGINWTKDGRFLLFVRATEKPAAPAELWRVPVQGGAPEKLGLAMPGLRDVRLHPDGRQIAFTAGEGSDEVWVLENLSFAAPSAPSTARGRR